MTDWKLISKGLLGIYWIKECNKVENKDRTLTELYETEFREGWNGERLLNTGVLMMASYLLFVYPQQADFENIDFSNIDISKFRILQQDNENNGPKRFCKRLRNSISHAHFIVNDETNRINFKDDNRGEDKIEFEIGVVDFGAFIDNFAYTVNSQMIENSK